MCRYVFIFILFFVCHAQASDLTTSYEVTIDLRNFKGRTYPVHTKAKIQNDSQVPLHHLVWMLYPNRFEKKLPNINDVNLHRIYPHGYSKGKWEMQDVVINGKSTELDAFSNLNQDKFGGVFVKQQLAQPLLPGEAVEIEMQGVLHVPHKFGSFGWYRNQLTLSGGWSPMIISFEGGTFHLDISCPLPIGAYT